MEQSHATAWHDMRKFISPTIHMQNTTNNVKPAVLTRSLKKTREKYRARVLEKNIGKSSKNKIREKERYVSRRRRVCNSVNLNEFGFLLNCNLIFRTRS